MDNDLQDRLIPLFHYALAPGGVLVLGSSETIARHERLFLPLDRPHRISSRRDGPSGVPSQYQMEVGDPRSKMGAGIAGRTDPKALWQKAVVFANRRTGTHRLAVVVVSAGGRRLVGSRRER
jgi:hypothetical protein